MTTKFTVSDIIWKNSYNLENDRLDDEHQKLFSIAQKAALISEYDTEEKKIIFMQEILRELYAYTQYHFKSEEVYMEFIEYPLIEDHKVLHAKLLDQIKYIIMHVSMMGTEKAQERIYNFVQKIFVAHITTEDKKIAQFQKRQ